jgi:ATP-dependent RNA helicase DDX42
MGIPEPSPI